MNTASFGTIFVIWLELGSTVLAVIAEAWFDGISTVPWSLIRLYFSSSISFVDAWHSVRFPGPSGSSSVSSSSGSSIGWWTLLTHSNCLAIVALPALLTRLNHWVIWNQYGSSADAALSTCCNLPANLAFAALSTWWNRWAIWNQSGSSADAALSTH